MSVLEQSKIKQREARITVEAERDQGVTSRVLDLLGSHDQFVTSFSLERQKTGLALELGLPALSGQSAERLAVLLQAVPGVRHAIFSPPPLG